MTFLSSLSLLLFLLFQSSVSALLPFPHPVSHKSRKNFHAAKPHTPSHIHAHAPVLTFTPHFLTAGLPTNINIVLNISTLPRRDLVKTVDYYIVYQVDPFTRQPLDVKFDLRDNGKAPTGDKGRRDFSFSNTLPFRFDNTFDSLSFSAVPVISGVEVPDSELATFAPKAITVFPPSPSMDVPSLEHVTTVPSLKGLELQVTYVWKSDLNLNSATEFLRDIAGYRCPGHNDLVVFDGEKRDLVNRETSIVHLGRALEEGKWKLSTLIKLKAGWRNTQSREPAEVVIVLRDSVTKEELPETRLAMPIIPGSQKLCARDIVGVVNVLIDNKAHLTLSAM